MNRLLVLALLVALPAAAAEAVTLPRGTWVLDVGYLHTAVNKQWDGQRHEQSLIEDIRR